MLKKWLSIICLSIITTTATAQTLKKQWKVFSPVTNAKFITWDWNNRMSSGAAQHFAIEADRANTLYVGINNPISIAVENTSNKDLVVKSSFGKFKFENGNYVLSADEPGGTQIIVYKKVNGKLKEIGKKGFSIKKFSPPVFKIGSGKDSATVKEVQSQTAVRADLPKELSQYGSYDMKFNIISFTLLIVKHEPCGNVETKNLGNALNENVKKEFALLKPADILIFKDIVCNGPGGIEYPAAKMVLLY